MKKMLIVYYSWSNGNTERIAKQLQTTTGADIARIDTVTAYPRDYNTTVNQGQQEVESGYMPPIKPIEKDISDYDVVAVGTPTWWYTMAPAVLTFMKAQDWNGKTVIPFMTNGGWPGHVIKDMTKAAEGARVVCPMEIKFDSNGGDILETSEKDIANWINSVKKILED